MFPSSATRETVFPVAQNVFCREVETCLAARNNVSRVVKLGTLGKYVSVGNVSGNMFPTCFLVLPGLKARAFCVHLFCICA